CLNKLSIKWLAHCVKMPNFAQVVKQVFDGWTVLQLAVEHGFGGIESAAKADWMVTAVDQWFSENDDLETYEVEEFLAQILDAEFNTVADDGSLIQVSKVLCTSHQLLQIGDADELEKYLLSLPQKAASGQSVTRALTSEEQDEDERMETDECCECSQSNMEVRSLSSGSRENESSQLGVINDDKPGEYVDNIQDPEEDGWTVVRKGKKR
ncbi:hypothetical protein LSH36_683g03150, partial [Paralvinella palmiformis]